MASDVVLPRSLSQRDLSRNKRDISAKSWRCWLFLDSPVTRSKIKSNGSSLAVVNSTRVASRAKTARGVFWLGRVMCSMAAPVDRCCRALGVWLRMASDI